MLPSLLPPPLPSPPLPSPGAVSVHPLAFAPRPSFPRCRGLVSVCLRLLAPFLPLPLLFLPSRRVSSMFLASVFCLCRVRLGSTLESVFALGGARPDRAWCIDQNIYGVDTEVSAGVGSILARSDRYFCCDFTSRRLENYFNFLTASLQVRLKVQCVKLELIYDFYICKSLICCP